MFASFCKDQKYGGLNSSKFQAVSTAQIGGTFATQWVAIGPFLAELY